LGLTGSSGFGPPATLVFVLGPPATAKLNSPSPIFLIPHLSPAAVESVKGEARLAAAMALPASSSGLFRFLSPRSRPQSTDIVAAATWGVFAGTAGLYLVQVRIDRPARISL